MPDLRWRVACDLRDRAAKAVAEVLSERALLRPDPEDEARAREVLAELVETENRRRALSGGAPLPEEACDEVVTHLSSILFGLGPLHRFLDGPELEELIVNGSRGAFVIRSGGRKERIDVSISDDELRGLMVRAANRYGRRLDEASPVVEVQLPFGRLHAVIPPLARYPCLTIRRQRLAANSLPELIALGTLGHQAAEFLASAVRGGLNIVVSGGTGTGKTTLAHALGCEIPEWERVVTIEETAELELDSALPDCVALGARFANVEGLGEVSIRELVRNALRMRPTRIVVGEVRGPEALDMLSAMNSGHEGSMCTIHASSARQALTKLRTYVLMAPEALSAQVASEMITETVDLVVHLRLRHADGRRVIASIVEVAGMEAGRVLVNEIFRLGPQGLAWTRLRPRCTERLQELGVVPDWLQAA